MHTDCPYGARAIHPAYRRLEAQAADYQNLFAGNALRVAIHPAAGAVNAGRMPGTGTKPKAAAKGGGPPAGPRYFSRQMARGQRYTWPDEHFTAPMIEKMINNMPTTGTIRKPIRTKQSAMLTTKYIKNDS